ATASMSTCRMVPAPSCGDSRIFGIRRGLSSTGCALRLRGVPTHEPGMERTSILRRSDSQLSNHRLSLFRPSLAQGSLQMTEQSALLARRASALFLVILLAFA